MYTFPAGSLSFRLPLRLLSRHNREMNWYRGFWRAALVIWIGSASIYYVAGIAEAVTNPGPLVRVDRLIVISADLGGTSFHLAMRI